MFHELWSAGPETFESRMIGQLGVHGLAEFWRHHETEPWFHQLPCSDVLRTEPHHCIPCRLHGDDINVTNDHSLVVLNWCSTQCRLDAWRARHLITVFSVGKQLEHVSTQPIYEAVAWSFDAIASGVFPHCDHLQCPWPAESRRSKLVGQALASRGRGVCCQILGDWKWVKEVFLLPQHYGRDA
eukprot:5438971-Lingulodinium_polyedra.AAC.1